MHHAPRTRHSARSGPLIDPYTLRPVGAATESPSSEAGFSTGSSAVTAARSTARARGMMAKLQQAGTEDNMDLEQVI